MKIRTKIMLGFLILAIMLAAAGAFSIYQLKTIGSSVQSLLDDNYRSINAAKKMTASLEREDRGMLLLFSGKRMEGRQTIREADANFREALKTAENSLTIDEEKAYVDRIRNLYGKYSALWERSIAGTADEGNLERYFKDVQPSFKAVKNAVQELMSINDKSMYETASGLENQAHRAIMPLVVAILSALVFTLLFNFFVNFYIVNPILSITRSIEGFLTHEKPIAVKLDADDELADLAGSVSNLAAMVKMDRHDTDQ